MLVTEESSYSKQNIQFLYLQDETAKSENIQRHIKSVKADQRTYKMHYL